MLWVKALAIAFVWFAILIVALFCALNLGITWIDPKGGASGGLPPVLTTAERVTRSIPAIVILLLMFGAIVLWWRRKRAI